MKTNKIGTVFLVSVLALAGIGISYAGLSDVIAVYGTVDTATVELVVESYSGTWVWKVWGWNQGYEPVNPNWVNTTWIPAKEVLIYSGGTNDKPSDSAIQGWLAGTGAQYTLVSYAQGRAPINTDPNKPNGQPYDAIIEFSELFPCMTFEADVVFHYIGSIPAKVKNMQIVWNDAWLNTLDAMWETSGGLYGLDATIYKFNSVGPTIIQGFQLHFCDKVKLDVKIHLPQDNQWQGKVGTGYVYIELQQWNDECNGQTEDKTATVNLPTDSVKIKFEYPYAGVSYWKETIMQFITPSATYSPPLNGATPIVCTGWCVDQDNTIGNGAQYWCHLYSSYAGDNPYPDSDWPKVNWIINHKADFPGALYTDFQDAIWFFIDHGAEPPTVIGKAIRDAALAQGSFVPQAGQLIAVLVQVDLNSPTGEYQGVHQYTFIEVDP